MTNPSRAISSGADRQFLLYNDRAFPRLDPDADSVQADIGTVGSTVSDTTVEYEILANGAIKFTFTAFELTMTDSAGNGGHGSIALWNFPSGKNFACNSAGLKLSWTSTGAASGVVDIALGTAAAGVDNEVLATTEQNITGKIEDTNDGSGVGDGEAFNVTPVAIADDGTIYLNLAITDATVTATGSFVFTGTAVVNIAPLD